MDNPATASNEDQPLVELAAPPPLRLSHIFLVTAVTALLLTAHRTLVASNELGPANGTTGAWTIFHLVSNGVAISLVGLGVFCGRPGWSFFQQPGHWLLALEALPILQNALWNLYYLNGSPWWMLTFLLPIPGTAELILRFAAAWKGFGSPWWRIFFLALVVLEVIPFVAPLSGGRLAYGFFYFATLLAVIALAAFSDLRMSHQRDWMHWAGVAIAVLGLIVGESTFVSYALDG